MVGRPSRGWSGCWAGGRRGGKCSCSPCRRRQRSPSCPGTWSSIRRFASRRAPGAAQRRRVETLASRSAPPLVWFRSDRLEGGATMRIHNLYTDASGQSHFRDIEVEWVEETRGGKLSKRLPATGIIFREVPPTYDLDWHPAPRRQYIINLDAGVEITASDGKIRNCIFVPID